MRDEKWCGSPQDEFSWSFSVARWASVNSIARRATWSVNNTIPSSSSPSVGGHEDEWGETNGTHNISVYKWPFVWSVRNPYNFFIPDTPFFALFTTFPNDALRRGRIWSLFTAHNDQQLGWTAPPKKNEAGDQIRNAIFEWFVEILGDSTSRLNGILMKAALHRHK